jgi:sodium transport system permease protein
MRDPLLVVYLKEVRDAMRDRRTMLMVFVASILTGPVFLVLLAQFFSSIEEKSSVLKVRIAGLERARALVNFLERNDVQIEAAPLDYEARVREGRLDAVIVVPVDFDERYLSGDNARVEIVYDDSRADSRPGIAQAERLLQAFNRETGTLRLMARGVSPDLAAPVKVERVNTATPRQRGAQLLFLIPMFAIMAPLLGGMTVAIDSTAGERERGSLEPLLANPVEVWRIALGKWLASWTFASAVSAMTLGGFVLAASLYAGKRLAAFLTFGTPEFTSFMILAIPFAAMTTSLQLLVCTYGRTYREAQTYATYLSTVVPFVPVLVFFGGLKDATWQLFVPVLAQQMVFTRIVRGEAVVLEDWLVPSAMAFLVAAVCVALVARLLRDEKIIFGRS